ncbi:hypothetical protein ILYODFUR_037346, partial [Ilyodon furcidens]
MWTLSTSPPHSGTSSLQPVSTLLPSTSAAQAVTTSEAPNKPTLTSSSSNLSSSVQSNPSSNVSAITSPASTSNETTLSSATIQSSPQTSTSPPSTQPTTTMAATTAEANTDPKCSYSVETIQFGLRMNMTDFTAGNYTIKVAEKEGPFERRSTVSFSNENSTHEIKPLKPCTKYQLIVRLIATNGTEIPCKKTEYKTTTTGMSEQDIKKTSCPSGYLCYQSGWNISSLVSKHNEVSDAEFINGSYRFKPAYEDICSDFVLEFLDENCNVSLTSSEYIPVDFIDPNDINQTKPTELPAKIETKLPSNCKNLSVEYKCS